MSFDTTAIRKRIADIRQHFDDFFGSGGVDLESGIALQRPSMVMMRISDIESVLAELDKLREQTRSKDCAACSGSGVDQDTIDPDGGNADGDKCGVCGGSGRLTAEGENTFLKGMLNATKNERSQAAQERDSLKRENLELRSRTVFPKAALAAKLAEAARALVNYGNGTPPTGDLLNALHAYEKEDAEYPFVPADCDVRRVMISIVPGPDGEGVEVYAKNVKEVEEELAKISEQAEDNEMLAVRLQGQLDEARVKKPTLEEARIICEGGHDFGPEKIHREKLKSGVVFCVNMRWPWGVHWEDGETPEHFGSEEAALLSVGYMRDATAKRLSTRPCGRCKAHHKLDEFEQDATVLIHDSDSPLFGWKGTVVGWSQYGCALTYRVQFGANRENFDPCQLKAVPA